MKPENFFVHLRVNEGAATLAVLGDWVGVALCSPRDQFSRAVGRSIALSRAASFAGPRPARLAFALPPAEEGSREGLRDRVVRAFVQHLCEGTGGIKWLDRDGCFRVGPWNDRDGEPRVMP